jgi:DNA/RNA-binding domain of Phe-tRNA-synthetase-like protein
VTSERPSTEPTASQLEAIAELFIALSRTVQALAAAQALTDRRLSELAEALIALGDRS